jgi:protein gp37
VPIGTSVENGDYLGRIDELRKVSAKIRFISFEPLLGSVAEADLREIHWAIVGGESGPQSRADDRGVGRRDRDGVSGGWHGILLQAVGRRSEESDRPDDVCYEGRTEMLFQRVSPVLLTRVDKEIEEFPTRPHQGRKPCNLLGKL